MAKKYKQGASVNMKLHEIIKGVNLICIIN